MNENLKEWKEASEWSFKDEVLWLKDSDDIADVNYKCVIDNAEYLIKRGEHLWELSCNDVVIDKDQYRVDLACRILKTIKKIKEKKQ